MQIGEDQDYFKPGDTVNFYINDNDLAQPTVNQKTTVMWYLDSGSDVTQGQNINLANGQLDDMAVGGESWDLLCVVFSTSTNHMRYAPHGMISSDTPLVRASVQVTVANDEGDEDGDRLVTGVDPVTGIIRIFGDVQGQDGDSDLNDGRLRDH